jgi:hypothetical protein
MHKHNQTDFSEYQLAMQRYPGFVYQGDDQPAFNRLLTRFESISLADLRQRTGLPIKRVEVGRVDFLADTQ